MNAYQSFVSSEYKGAYIAPYKSEAPRQITAKDPLGLFRNVLCTLTVMFGGDITGGFKQAGLKRHTHGDVCKIRYSKGVLNGWMRKK